LARPKILDWAWKQYHPSTPTSTKPEAVLANWLKIQPQNPKDTDYILKIFKFFELTIKNLFWIFSAKFS
jgi:hypothetical protein